ncbi:propionyl-CoA carboxylase alpha chain [Flavobacterium sp. 7E]|uniref:acetyl-CoA carboxylase biotin carboxylase subunit n=1 Tax=Flavobacterium sp. 7E TaxID=2735898 RepID=UPI00156E7EF4|nr:acetyl-CoA carboxylase biotin carboxylase subunit [Flavobacterium sp. 7E]NRS89224.1 propionyl-CoA carboxylase alpha chain [Flavobacterium sp. 7E]
MKKILVANRGEIAIRVMKTAQKMGIKTVAVYSTADRNAPHVKFADEAVWIGESPSSQSYLLGDKIIEVAKNLGVDAIHPGYGFLSENADFAEKAEKNNIIFIGPKSKAIHIMGNKLAAKEAVKVYNIPMVPGLDEAITDIDKAKIVASEIGFPILIKASAGGGGKGMRIVENAEEFESQMKRAISEAINAFGDGAVFIEKYVASPRHIEIQIMADSHGTILYLFERECSIQRRHQKVVEEAPSSVLTAELRKKMGEAAVLVAKACDYLGAGTVEFLLDENHNFYFLEMNTRLQVEHPVTELITGLDLVEMQIKVARGEALTLRQEDLKIKGHAMELRVYAEDPMNDFLPSVGHLDVYKLPSGKGIRVDNGFEQGMDIPIYYDPMLAKLITYGETREEAIQIMIKAIADYQVEGVQTTLPFGAFVMEHEAFRSGNFDTHFVKKYYSANLLKAEITKEAEIAARIALKQYFEDQKIVRLPN